MFGYRVPEPDDVMLVSGGKHGRDDAPFRIIIGHGAFVMAPFRKARFLTLAMQEAEVAERCVTVQGIPLTVKAVVAFKVAPDEESIVNAGQRFLSDEQQMPSLTGQIFAGHLRAIIGAMTVEEIVRDRQKLAGEVLDASKAEVVKLGLLVDSFQIQSVDDMGSGYIDAMSAPHRAAIQRDATIAAANAKQAATEAEQEASRKQIGYQQETTIAQAQADQASQVAEAKAQAEIQRAQAQAGQTVQIAQADASRQTQVAQATAAREAQVAQATAKADIDAAQAKAAQAGPLATAKATLEVTTAQTQVAERQAELRARQLEAEVIKPAEAEARKVTILAKAEADAQKLRADALAQAGAVTLQSKIADSLPDIVRAAASAYQGSHVTILNGADGITGQMGSIVAQGLAIWETLRQTIPPQAANGQQADRHPAVRG